MAEQPPPSQTPPAQTPPPQWAPPQQQPAWGQPPPGAWGQPGYSGPPPRPTLVTIGAIWLIVLGILLTIPGACTTVGGSLFVGADNNTLPGVGAVGGAIAVVGIIIVVLGILQIVAGAGALGGKGWGRWIGVVVSVIFALLGLLSVLGTLGSLNQSGGITALVISLFFLVGYGLTAFAFISSGQYFSYRR